MTEQTNSSCAGRTLVVMLCMHRSGSSLVTNLFQRLGMSLGSFELLDGNEHNKYGHFEAVPMYQLNQELLGQIFGFTEDVPDSPQVLRRFCAAEGRWELEASFVSDQQIERGRRLIEQLVASGEISGFKDPRVALLWPFWKRVFSAFAGLRIVPLVLTRSPHEVAMSIFLRSNGAIGYFDALDVTAVHYRQMNWILESWAGERAVVRFDLRVFTADLHEAVRACGLSWRDEVFAQVYDASCRHHEPAVVTHEAEALFQRLGPLPTDRHDPANVSRLERDAATRENLIRARLAETQRDAEQQALIIEQCRRAEAEMIEQRRRTEVEMQERIAALEHQIAAITATRTWQWHNRVLDMPAGRWLANVLRVAKGWKGPAGTGTKKARP